LSEEGRADGSGFSGDLVWEKVHTAAQVEDD
jgi:hypothetical protein